MSDIVERLRAPIISFEDNSSRRYQALATEAASEIERLRAELADWKRQASIEAESLDEIEAEMDSLRTELADKRPHPTFGEWVTEPRTVALMKRCTAAESERDRYKGALETELRLLNDSLRGTTHYDGCEAHHPKCAAVKSISDALRGDAAAESFPVVDSFSTSYVCSKCGTPIWSPDIPCGRCSIAATKAP